MEPREAQRILSIVILGIVIVALFFTNKYLDKKAIEEGYSSLEDKQISETIEIKLKDYKHILIVADDTMESDNLLVDNLKADGYKVSFSNGVSISYINGSLDSLTFGNNIGIISGGSLVDYLMNASEYKKTRAEVKKGVADSIELLGKNTIVVTSPCYKFDTTEKFESEIPYEEYMKMVVDECKKQNVRCIDLYTYTKNNPVLVTLNGPEELDDDTYNYIYNEIIPMIEPMIEEYRQELIKTYREPYIDD